MPIGILTTCLYNTYFAQMVSQIYPNELQLNKANFSDTEATFLDLNFSITNGIVSTNFFINGTPFILKYLVFHLLMEMFFAPLPMVYTFQNLFVLQEYNCMWMTFTIETKC